MSIFLGTSVFWTTVLAIPAILTVATIVGRLWSISFPPEYRSAARFYLSPALGIASFVLIASLVGRQWPLGDTILTPFIVLSAMACALKYDPARSELLRHLAIVGCFGLVCGASLLAPLYVHGAFNAHNDTFTYLAHGDWLQRNAFGAVIPVAEATPASTQVLQYQVLGFRMGASYLLGFFQAFLNIRWAYDAYPALVIAAMTSCCLAIGFLLAPILERLKLGLRLGLLALPSFSLGGLVFGANFGFFPQTVGFSAAATAIFSVGAVMSSLSTRPWPLKSIVVVSLPIALAVSAAILAYSELAPFLAAAIGLSGLWFAVRFRAWRNVIALGCSVTLLIVLLTNVELVRAFNSLRVQSGAVVGAPVPWSLLQFLGHVFGLKAGAWDTASLTSFAVTWSAFFVLLLAFGLRSAKWASARSILPAALPSVILLGVLLSAFLYFRYFVESPFPVGKGQSWSQFKLTEWSHPFASALVIFIAACLIADMSRLNARLMTALLFVALIGTWHVGMLRARGIMGYYTGTTDLRAFYRDLRRATFDICPLDRPIYLALGGPDHKFRQIASLFLADRLVRSDWTDDGYISHYLPPNEVSRSPEKGDCIIRPNFDRESTNSGATVGQFSIALFDGVGRIPIASVEGGYERETDARSWWHWVERSISFNFKPTNLTDRKVKLRFDYAVRPDVALRVRIVNSRSGVAIFESDLSKSASSFAHDIGMSGVDDLRVTIDTTDNATVMSDRDPRRVAFRISNLTVRSVQE